MSAMNDLLTLLKTEGGSDLHLAAGQPPTVRMQAAAVLMWDQSRQGLAALAAMLDDPNPRVRTAAAGAILSRANSATRR